MILLAIGWAKELAGAQLAASLTDQAAMVLMTILSTQPSYDDIMAAVQWRFQALIHPELAKTMLMNRRRQSGEILPQLAQGIQHLAMMSYQSQEFIDSE